MRLIQILSAADADTLGALGLASPPTAGAQKGGGGDILAEMVLSDLGEKDETTSPA
jgi:hypothetical protein